MVDAGWAGAEGPIWPVTPAGRSKAAGASAGVTDAADEASARAAPATTGAAPGGVARPPAGDPPDVLGQGLGPLLAMSWGYSPRPLGHDLSAGTKKDVVVADSAARLLKLLALLQRRPSWSGPARRSARCRHAHGPSGHRAGSRPSATRSRARRARRAVTGWGPVPTCLRSCWTSRRQWLSPYCWALPPGWRCPGSSAPPWPRWPG